MKSIFLHSFLSFLRMITLLVLMFASTQVIFAQQKDNVKAEFFQELDAAFDKARNESASELSPKLFSKAFDLYKRAERDYDHGERVDKIHKKITEAQITINKAISVAQKSRLILAELLTVRQQVTSRRDYIAIEPKMFAAAERKYNQAITKAEEGKIEPAKKVAGEAIEIYRQITANALLAGPINDAEKLIKTQKYLSPHERKQAELALEELKKSLKSTDSQPFKSSQLESRVFAQLNHIVGFNSRRAVRDLQVGNPIPISIPVIKPLKPVLPEVDSLDYLAHLTQKEFTRLAKKWRYDEPRRMKIPKDTLLLFKTVNNWVTAETILDSALEDAWNSFPEIKEEIFHSNKIIELAGINLGIETRRNLGGEFHTLVPGLNNDSGCRGDITNDRLILKYFKTITNSVLVEQGNNKAAAEILEKFARQIACIGNGQLAALDYYFSLSFEMVVNNMKKNNFGYLVPLFVRTTAPLQLLILDARKNHGQFSASWRWFKKYGSELKNQVLSAGWATDQVFLWDRLNGVLVGLPGCINHDSPNCIDLVTLLESISDPRALGFGDCSLLGMVTRTPETIDGEPKYSCPSNICDNTDSQSFLNIVNSGPSLQNGNSTVPIRETQLGQGQKSYLNSIWPGLDNSDFNTMDGMCASLTDNFQSMGGVSKLADCFKEFVRGTSTPFENFLGCVIENTESSNPTSGAPTQVIGKVFKGVPGGNDCKFSVGMGGSVEESEETEEPQEPQTQEPSNEEKEKAAAEGNSIWGAVKNIVKVIAGYFKSKSPSPSVAVGVVGKTSGVIVNIGGQLMNEEGVEAERNIFIILARKASMDDMANGEITIEEQQEIMSSYKNIWEYLDKKKLLKENKDCFDEYCSNECTGLGRQISALNSCIDDYLGTVLTQTGKPLTELPSAPPLDPLVNPVPDDPDVIEPGLAGTFACVESTHSGNPAKKPQFCGLIYCAENAGVAIGGIGSCKCGGAQTLTGFAQPCLSMDCVDGVPNEDCQCDEFTEIGPDRPGGIGPGPDPITILETAIRIRENTWGNEKPSVAILLNNLAVSYYSEGKSQKSIQILESTKVKYQGTLINQKGALELMNNNLELIKSQETKQ